MLLLLRFTFLCREAAWFARNTHALKLKLLVERKVFIGWLWRSSFLSVDFCWFEKLLHYMLFRAYTFLFLPVFIIFIDLDHPDILKWFHLFFEKCIGWEIFLIFSHKFLRSTLYSTQPRNMVFLNLICHLSPVIDQTLSSGFKLVL